MRSLLICSILFITVSAFLSAEKKDVSTENTALISTSDEGLRHIPPGANEEGLVVRSKRYYDCGCCGGCCGCGCMCGTMAPMASMAPCPCMGCCG